MSNGERSEAAGSIAVRAVRWHRAEETYDEDFARNARLSRQDATYEALRQAITRHWGIPQHDVVAGPGPVGVFRDIVHTFAGQGDSVVYAWRSYEVYPITVQPAGARLGTNDARRWPSP
jgi:histidinol-phosphate/aromatic aminotransferase/cobyric acid decarboxylase-like protein